ncbi:MAG: thiol-disulfide oxidoreductase DCC family protein [Ferruginibacter sp.]
MDDHPIILFDGICNLCNSSVQYVIKHDPHAIFRFASLQGETGQQLLKQYGLPPNDLNSFVLIRDNKLYTRSAAALNVAKQLTGSTRFLYGFIIVPPFIRNAVYDLIAKNRYKWFGKKEACMIPTAALRSRFLN